MLRPSAVFAQGPNGTFGLYISATSGMSAAANRTTLYSCKGTASSKPALLTTSAVCENIYGSAYSVTPIGAVATTKARSWHRQFYHHKCHAASAAAGRVPWPVSKFKLHFRSRNFSPPRTHVSAQRVLCWRCRVEASCGR